MSRAVSVRAPATTANLGPAFDCAAAAFDLWNEVEVQEGGDGGDPEHLGVRAFSLVHPPDGLAFRFTSRIPRERGLGSSASVTALGLLAGTAVAGREPDLEHLLALGTGLEGHADNLAAALAGGVTLTWDGRIARIADDLPAEAVALVPAHGVNTLASRASLPGGIAHADAAFTAGRAAMLGAAIAAGDPELFGAALADRLHEPYRSELLAAVRADLPAAALGATLSGSGPTVIVWARRGSGAACEDVLRARYPQETILRLTVTPRGAGTT